MPRKKKSARDMTTEELAKKVFPAKVLKELKRTAHEGDDKPKKQGESDTDTSP